MTSISKSNDVLQPTFHVCDDYLFSIVLFQFLVEVLKFVSISSL